MLSAAVKPTAPPPTRRPVPEPPSRSRRCRAAIVFALAFGLAGLAAAPCGAIIIGRPKPVCEEIVRLEGVLYIAVVDPDGGEPDFVAIESGKSDPLILTEGRVYRLTLRAGPGLEAPVIPARYRLESRSFLTLTAHGAGELALPLTREFSINALEELVVYTRHPGRRRLYLRVSECYKGGSRFLHHPSETLIPIVVVSPREEER